MDTARSRWLRATCDASKIDFGQDQIALATIEPPEAFDRRFPEQLAAFHFISAFRRHLARAHDGERA